MSELRVVKHPDKTFIGRVARGLDFLGYWFSSAGLGIAWMTVERMVENMRRLYEQGAPDERIEAYFQRWCRWVTGGISDKQNAELLQRHSAVRISPTDPSAIALKSSIRLLSFALVSPLLCSLHILVCPSFHGRAFRGVFVLFFLLRPSPSPSPPLSRLMAPSLPLFVYGYCRVIACHSGALCITFEGHGHRVCHSRLALFLMIVAGSCGEQIVFPGG